MNNIYPIYIPSKKRPNCKTLEHVKDLKCKKFLFIEKEDVKHYEHHSGNVEIVILEKSNQGVSYVRQCIKQHAEANNFEWFWCIDDDIQKFQKIQRDGKLKNVPIDFALRDAQEIILSHKNIGIGSLNFGQYAFGEGVLKKPYSLNKRCIVCTLNNVSIQKQFEYDLNCILKEDIDFNLKILSAGHRSIICNGIAFSTPKAATSKGGCHEIYKKEKSEKMASDYLQNKWGRNTVITVLTKDGSYDAKVNWSKFK